MKTLSKIKDNWFKFRTKTLSISTTYVDLTGGEHESWCLKCSWRLLAFVVRTFFSANKSVIIFLMSYRTRQKENNIHNHQIGHQCSTTKPEFILPASNNNEFFILFCGEKLNSVRIKIYNEKWTQKSAKKRKKKIWDWVKFNLVKPPPPPIKKNKPKTKN